jgi:formylglycine-generating enzyme required for sulfatase activity
MCPGSTVAIVMRPSDNCHALHSWTALPMIRLMQLAQLGVLTMVTSGLIVIGSVRGQPAPTPAASTQKVVNEMNSLNMTFVRVPAGEYLMGSPASLKDRFDNETQHRVKLSKPFLIATTPVTVRQFAEFVKQSGYETVAEKEGWAYGAWNVKENQWDKLVGASWRKPGFEQADDHPVVSVNWHDAIAFCKWLSDKEGRAYRLPTEAQWEYACRAGSTSAYFWGDEPNDGKGLLNAADETAKDRFNIFPPFDWSDGFLHTSPVGAFKPNTWGLHDMLGNTLEWCSDWFGEYAAGDLVVDPTGALTGAQRVLRGGAFVYGPRHCRSAFRGRNSPDFRNFYIGFRVLREE